MVDKNVKKKLGEIGKFLGKTPRFLGEKSFFIFFPFLFLEILFASILLYQPLFLAKKFHLDTSIGVVKFQEQVLEKILGEWEERKKISDEAGKKQYLDPFWGTISPTPTEEKQIEELTP